MHPMTKRVEILRGKIRERRKRSPEYKILVWIFIIFRDINKKNF